MSGAALDAAGGCFTVRVPPSALRTVRTRGVSACVVCVRRYGADGLLTKTCVVAVCLASDSRL